MQALFTDNVTILLGKLSGYTLFRAEKYYRTAASSIIDVDAKIDFSGKIDAVFVRTAIIL